jgi:hypothetical protein
MNATYHHLFGYKNNQYSIQLYSMSFIFCSEMRRPDKKEHFPSFLPSPSLPSLPLPFPLSIGGD